VESKCLLLRKLRNVIGGGGGGGGREAPRGGMLILMNSIRDTDVVNRRWWS
jgi:hypothetical protein